MALTYTIDPIRRIVTIAGEYADAGEWRVILEAILGDPGYAPGCGFIRDLRHARRPVDGPAVMRIIAVVREFWPYLRPTRAAIVTPRDLDAPALMAHALADEQHLPLRAFTSHDAAEAWVREGGTRDP